MIGITIPAKSQDCVHCNGSSATGNNASAIGSGNTASGNNSLAGGYNSQATGSNSLAFGYNSKATQSTTIAEGNTAIASGVGSIAIGNYVSATAKNTIVIGTGTTASYPLTNNTTNSIAMGINSNKPTLLITKALNNNYTGKVAIGNVTPTTKLHIKSDNNEDAGVFIEPANKNNWKAFIKLYDDEHGISVDKTAAMELNSGNGQLKLVGEHYCFGNQNEKKARIYTNGNGALYYNATRYNNTEYRDMDGTAYAIDFKDNALSFRLALNQTPRGSEITNWKSALILNSDGKVGIGSTTTYLKNNSDQQFIINSPKTIDLQSSNITLTGKIGINTVNTVSDYALAVDGGIVSTKVFIKDVKQWPDHVFSNDYDLLTLQELKSYLDDNRHLPGVPSETEILGNGYDLNEMQAVLLEKIEEMTRYILLLNDEIDLLKSRNEFLRDSILFSYDENGNRISRSLLFKRIDQPNQDPTTAAQTSYDLFPNPTPGLFSIVLRDPSHSGNPHAILLNAAGSVVEEKDLDGNSTTFDLSHHPAGIYLLHIEGSEGCQSWKVIKR